MASITYKGKQYPVRIISVAAPDYSRATITIAPQSLEDQLDTDESHEDMTLDETIYYYVPDELITLPGATLVNEHLDGHYVFSSEFID